MVESADKELAALVRRVLRLPEWRVQVVDNPDEACAMFAQDLVRVQRHWREAVFETVVHHPLSLVRMRRRIGLEIWKVRAIRREQRTLTEVRGYLARATSASGPAFGRNLREAALEAARGPDPGPVLTPQALARRARRRCAVMQDLARSRYNGGFLVAAATYER